ncbi:MAG TPA: N-acetylmuramoyl-L-alanine amidase [Terriglobales bacterium]|nr:N-acetylmuramoyl-L-alanine amidase [Terriglobales bacterium]
MKTAVHFTRGYVFLLIFFLGGSLAQEKKLTVYSPQGSAVYAVVDRNGTEYLALQDILSQFGNVSTKQSGSTFSIRFTGRSGPPIDATFAQNRTSGSIGKRRVELPSPFLLSGDRGLVPVASLPQLLPGFTGTTVSLHQLARRLFVASASTNYGFDLQRTAPPRLVLHFSTPVNPSVATEPGRLRMTFSREPLIATSKSTNLGDNTFSTLTYNEWNGTAELSVSANAPLLASFGDGGKTITITAQATPQSLAATPKQNQVPGASATPNTAAVPPLPQPPHFTIVLDPAHGGEDRGAALTPTLPEKDVVLAFARRLRTALQNQGIDVILLRDSDVALSADQRAIAANAARPALILSIHATSSGSGVHLFTAMLSPAPRTAFLPWDTAQAAFLNDSSAIAAAVSKQLNSRDIEDESLSAPLQPLSSFARPAIAIELTPLNGKADSLGLPSYQQPIITSITAAITDMRPLLEQSR